MFLDFDFLSFLSFLSFSCLSCNCLGACSCASKGEFREDVFYHIRREDLPMSLRGPFKCDHCDKMCKTKYLLGQHVKSKHKSCENPLIPPPLSSTPRRSERICSTNSSVLGSGSTLNQVSSAEVQTAAMTVNVVRIPCLLCGKSYQTQRWLVSQLPTANLSLASMPQPGMIPRQQCPECSWTGATAALLQL